jgi:hypothetical protein
MSKTNDGGPAYPFDWIDTQPHTGKQVIRQQFDGMSLRDYFAGQALAGMHANDGSRSYSTSELANMAYDQADAMLAQREGGGDE